MGEVTLTNEGAINWVTISNVARRNAMSRDMWVQLAQIIKQVESDPQSRVVVLRGDGDKAFVSGADISEFEGRADSTAASEDFSRAVEAAEHSLIDCSRPVIAMMRGICMGGGLGLSVSCDLRYSTVDTRFRMPAARLGVGYSVDSMRRIVDVIGATGASDIFHTARIFDGEEAQRLGLVHRAVADDKLEPLVQETAEMIAANAPLTMKAAKLAIRASSANTTAEIETLANQAIARCGNSADFVEGRTAFMEKRVAKFQGK